MVFVVNTDSNSSIPQLTFCGRVGDSLMFGVSGTDAFRYDMPTDTAGVLSKTISNPVIDTKTFPHPLKAYPFFIYFEPGTPLIPISSFSTTLTIAGHLRSHRHFEAALKWYELTFNPLHRENTWVISSSDVGVNPSEAFSLSKVKSRAVLLEYLETLLEWAESLVREWSSAGSQRASMIFNIVERILGRRARRFSSQSIGSSTMSIETFVPSAPAVNPRQVEVYDRLEDARSQASYHGDELYPRGQTSFNKYQINHSPYRCHPYRFLSLYPKAIELVSYVRSLGASLLSAFERGDTKYLSSLQNMHDRQVTDLSLETKKN